ncbi:MAG: RidA family protein [Planctomycetota bacterium]|nr:RidA family protein [Planctomycetota bacterium]
MTSIQDRLSDLGVILPDPPKPVASYVPARRSGSMLYISGQLPFRGGDLLATGPVPSSVSLETAVEAARLCAINGLAVARQALDGDLDRLRRVIRLGVFVQSDARFDAQPQVANGASDLMVEVLGEEGRHARAAVGVNALPLDTPVEVDFLFEVE